MSNRRDQRPKSNKNKKTSPFKSEKRIKGVGSPRNPKHRNRGPDDEQP